MFSSSAKMVTISSFVPGLLSNIPNFTSLASQPHSSELGHLLRPTASKLGKGGGKTRVLFYHPPRLLVSGTGKKGKWISTIPETDIERAYATVSRGPRVREVEQAFNIFVGLLLLQLPMIMSRLHFASCAIQHRSPIGYGSIDVNIFPFSSGSPYLPSSGWRPLPMSTNQGWY
jgi:hypothetical protein